jgi:hypothetical protein
MRSRFLRLNGVVNMHLFFYFFIFILQMSQIEILLKVALNTIQPTIILTNGYLVAIVFNLFLS